jgi:hypothetical protein
MSPQSLLDELTRKFFSAFVTPDIRPLDLKALNDLFIPEAIIIKTCGTKPVVFSRETFIETRREILTSGKLLRFQEHEVSGHTEIFGDIAHRWSLYEKSGVTDGKAFQLKGMKTIQFVCVSGEWKISAVAWDDEREGLAIKTGTTRPQ